MAKKRAKKSESKSRVDASLTAIKSKINDNAARIREMGDQARDKMSERPVETAAIAFGVGVLAGIGIKVLFDSKRR